MRLPLGLACQIKILMISPDTAVTVRTEKYSHYIHNYSTYSHDNVHQIYMCVLTWLCEELKNNCHHGGELQEH